MGASPKKVDLSKINAARVAHNFLRGMNGSGGTIDDINTLNNYVNYVVNPDNSELPAKKVGLMFVCINENYWRYIEPILNDVKAYFLPGHNVEVMVWTDLPDEGSEDAKRRIAAHPTQAQYDEAVAAGTLDKNTPTSEYVSEMISKKLEYKKFQVDSVPWPYPTLMRYNLMLQQEDYLKDFDYIFYLDLDMRMVNLVGDEILGDGLTCAQHPMYALRKEYWMPLEPNPESQAHIKQPGVIIQDNGRPRFKPIYAAGGFQGGTTKTFIPAMKEMQKIVNSDLERNYIPIWNDETVWNKYLFDHPASVVLTPSYIYPDSLIKEYYEPLWGCSYQPRIITITKPFSLTKEGGDHIKQFLQS